MRRDRLNILVTRPLTDRQLEYARTLGLEAITEPALEFQFTASWDKTLTAIDEHPGSDWVFTSVNGVRALARMIDSGLRVRPETRLFAVGAKTRAALRELGLDAIIPHIQYGKHLGELIVSKGETDSVIYFRGNLSRDEMTRILIQGDIQVIELEVYKTIIQPVSLPAEVPVHAVLFYSPSAVQGFRQGHGFDRELPALFAIGHTTADALRQETDQNITVADEPATEQLLRTVADYLFNNKIKHQ